MPTPLVRPTDADLKATTDKILAVFDDNDSAVLRAFALGRALGLTLNDYPADTHTRQVLARAVLPLLHALVPDADFGDPIVPPPIGLAH
jgi:hypothetical protein